MPDLLAQLNPPQLAAVTLPDQSALVLAGAGSGKTRVLTTRIAWLIHTGRASAQEILAVTFTNKAAKEMSARLSVMLPVSTRGMWIGTFHGLCNRLLRLHHRDAGLDASYQILDMADQLAMIKRVMRAEGVDEGRFPPRQVAWFINQSKEEGLRAKDVSVDDVFNARFVEIYRAYEEASRRESAVDFAELMLRSFELLSGNEALRHHYQARFRHILIDEFQDTNRLQYEWIRLFAAPGTERPNAVFAVGDDDQSIYAFRGAHVGNMARFEREFAIDNLVKLEQNYRSQGNILDAANVLIRNNHARLGKELWTAAGAGEPVRVYEALGDTEEARWVTEEAQALARTGVARSAIAVLYRSNAQSRVIEHALFGAGVPYRVYGGLRFFERQEVKHALAYLRLVANPHDAAAFLRVVNFPARGIGARTLEQLQDAARASDMSLWSSAAGMSGKSGQALAGFLRLIGSMREATHQAPLDQMVRVVIDESGLLAHYRLEREGQERVENLNELVNAATSFAAETGVAADKPAREALPSESASTTAGVSPLDSFLSHASLEAGEFQAIEGQDALQVMTVHAAKGLEFDAVFITGLEEGLFPHENSLSESGGLEEERRLMYVAMTRARKRLYLSLSQMRMLHGQSRYHIRSRFFDELPEASLKWLTSRRHAGAGGTHGWRVAPTGAPDPAPEPWSAPQVSVQGFRVGQTVVHAKFGEGVIVNLEGGGGDARAQVNFGRNGVKWLALSVARLEPA